MESLSMTRRSFLGATAAMGAGVASVALAEEQVEQSRQIPGGDGKYVTKAMGHEDYIYVCTTLRDGAIAGCQVLAHSETIGIGSYACARIPAAIVANQSVNVPPVRGCSITSRAIMAAVSEAIEQSGYDLDAFSTPVVEPEDQREETIDVDVVVVGAGTAGVVCAAKLIDMGYSVAVVEKRAIPGGAMSMTYSGFPVAETTDILNFNFDGSVAPRYATYEGQCAHWASMVDPQFDRYEGKAPFMTSSYGGCNDMYGWLLDMGVGFNCLGNFEGAMMTGAGHYFAPGCYMGGAGYAMMTLARRVEGMGQTYYMTKCTELIQDEPGAPVKGIKAVGLRADDSETGFKLTVNAKATVVTTGGFAKNPEMLKEHYPEAAHLFFNAASSSTGEGIEMLVGAGSKYECEGRHLPGFMSSATYFELAFLPSAVPGIAVNSFGDYIGGNAGSHPFMGKMALDESQGGRFFYIFDEAGVPVVSDFEMFGFNTYKALFNRGEVLHYDTVEEAAADLDLPGLSAAIDANNEAALAGEKGYSFIETRYGIYLVAVMPTLYLTTTGACIDPQGRVLTDSYVIDGDNTVIPGLYAAGDVCGSVEEKDGKNYSMGLTNTMGIAYNLARAIEEDGVTKA